MPLPITSLVAGLLALLMVPLSLQISLRRVALRTTFGDAEDDTLRRRIRAHGNFIEYVPTGLVLLALLELGPTPVFGVWAFAFTLLATRVLHLTGMLYVPRSPAPRAIAMVIQHFAFAIAGAWLVVVWMRST